MTYNELAILFRKLGHRSFLIYASPDDEVSDHKFKVDSLRGEKLVVLEVENKYMIAINPLQCKESVEP